MNACAGPLLRYRKMIGAEHVHVFTDIKKKHRYSFGESAVILKIISHQYTEFM